MHIVLLNETLFSPKSKFKILNYHIYRNDRAVEGTVILTLSRIIYKVIPIEGISIDNTTILINA